METGGVWTGSLKRVSRTLSPREDLKWVSKLQQDAHEATTFQRELAARDQEISRLHSRIEELEAYINQTVQEAAQQAVSQLQQDEGSSTVSQEEDATQCDAAEASSASDLPSAAAAEPTAAGVQRGEGLGPVDEQQDFAHSLLRGATFRSSRAYQLWRLASAAYGKKSHQEPAEFVSFEGVVWEVIAEDSTFNVRVIGTRERNGGPVEVAFRGTVSEDGWGERTSANWATNLDAKAAPLLAQEFQDVRVHRLGFSSIREEEP